MIIEFTIFWLFNWKNTTASNLIFYLFKSLKWSQILLIHSTAFYSINSMHPHFFMPNVVYGIRFFHNRFSYLESWNRNCYLIMRNTTLYESSDRDDGIAFPASLTFQSIKWSNPPKVNNLHERLPSKQSFCSPRSI